MFVFEALTGAALLAVFAHSELRARKLKKQLVSQTQTPQIKTLSLAERETARALPVAQPIIVTAPKSATLNGAARKHSDAAAKQAEQDRVRTAEANRAADRAAEAKHASDLLESARARLVVLREIAVASEPKRRTTSHKPASTVVQPTPAPARKLEPFEAA